MSSPAVSVLLPVRNAEATLGRAVESILRQTFDDFELIIINDGSTDASGAHAEALRRRDPRIQVLHTAGGGLVSALRLGLSASRATLVARMDADDEALPRRLTQSVAALGADPRLAAVGTQVEIFREDQPVSPNMRLYEEWLNALTNPVRLRAERFIESPLCHPSVTLRRSALEAVGGYEEGPFAEDYQLWLKLIAAGYTLTCLPEVLFRWRDHDQRLTRTDARYSDEAHAALKAAFLARDELAEGRCAIWGAGPIGLRLARHLRRCGVEVVRFLEVAPGKIGQRIDGTPVVSWETAREPDGIHLVAAVGAKGARERIREALRARRFVEGRDFTCAA